MAMHAINVLYEQSCSDLFSTAVNGFTAGQLDKLTGRGSRFSPRITAACRSNILMASLQIQLISLLVAPSG